MEWEAASEIIRASLSVCREENGGPEKSGDLLPVRSQASEPLALALTCLSSLLWGERVQLPRLENRRAGHLESCRPGLKSQVDHLHTRADLGTSQHVSGSSF